MRMFHVPNLLPGLKRLFLIFTMLACFTGQTFAISDSTLDSIQNDTYHYDPDASATSTTCVSSISGDMVTKFLQALAYQESGGNPKAQSKASSASGKYQYIDSTWRSHAKAYYPPGDAYARAYLAPDEVQDAVAYIEYSLKFKEQNGDLFRLAVGHFLPAALSNPALMDVRPKGNSITPRQYGEKFVTNINAGAGSNILIHPQDAPNFTEIAAQKGVTYGGTLSTSTCAADGVIAGDIVKTALNLAWDTNGHGKTKDDAKPEYQEAMPKYNGSKGDFEYSDCGVYVATVMRASGADPDYPKRGTAVQIQYIRNNPDKYLINENPKTTADLAPGDIVIYSAAPYGHTSIYVGPQTGSTGFNYTATSASLHSHVPQAVTSITYMFGKGAIVARLKK